MPAPYYLLIPDGPKRGAPLVAHSTLEAAEKEAKRLHALLKGKCYIRILETHHDLDATHYGKNHLRSEHDERVAYKKRRKIENIEARERCEMVSE